ncbi:MAG: CPBP family intramembrane metalloprotease [Puniceicoccales bacterium]|nr:CPBP family intramembrane metalloprotease [Puniceicoccales bacterium]
MKYKCITYTLGAYGVILLLAACLSPIIFACIQYLNVHYTCGFLAYLAHKPFGQYFDRCRLFSIFLTFPILLGCFKVHWTELKIQLTLRTFSIGIKFFALGIGLWFSFLVLIGYNIGFPELNNTSHPLLYTIVFSTVASILLACSEEIIFRGLLFRFFLKNMSEFWSLHWISFMFACLHFSTVRNSDVHYVLALKGFYSAFYSLIDTFTHIQWAYFFNLYILSCLLCLWVLKLKTLWSAIGFHAGLVFTLMYIRQHYCFSNVVHNKWGTGRITDSWAVFCILLLITFVIGCMRIRSHLPKQGD